MRRASVGRVWHLTTFVVAAVALLTQLVLVLGGQNVVDDTVVTAPLPERVRRLFSYFTIQANLGVAVSTWLVVRGRTGTRAFRVLRLASLIGIVVTGVVAAVALPPPPTYTTPNLVCDRLLHIVVPALTLIGWLVFGPRGLVTRRDLLPSLIWPVAWLAATLLLAPVTHWYPYPFLNVDAIGVGRVVVNCLLVAALFLLLAAVALVADRRLPGSRVPVPH